jgi:lysophospholipase L1-like esterase
MSLGRWLIHAVIILSLASALATLRKSTTFASWSPFLSSPKAMRPQFVLFGDSLTQRSFNTDGWAASLANVYQRKVDVVQRGYSGYNTRWALELLPKVFTLPQPPNSILLATIFFGANDAALADGRS